MAEFFFNYGLFTAKVVTFLVLVLIAVIAIVAIIAAREQQEETIEIEKVNDKFNNMKEALESETFSKEERRFLKKQEKKQKKKQEKEEAKAFKQRAKEGIFEPLRPRLFLLKFVGDMNASEVNNIREAITAILCIAKPEDEILVILESPGGLVHNYGLAASQLRRIRDRNIPLTISVDLVAASGGYLMACVANKIIAAPFAVVGSIGVIAQVPNVHRLLEKHDIDIEQHTAGEYKATLTLLGKNTDKARKKFREELEETHVLFKKFVQDNRPQLDVAKVSTGEHWYGAQALDLNLIDEIITSDDYLLNKNETTDIYEVRYVIPESLSDKISGFLHGFTMKLYRKFLGRVNIPGGY